MAARKSSLASAVDRAESKRVLVTGCGRSGTTYVSLLLRRCGLDVPHEHKMGIDGISSWLFAAESSEVPWGPSPCAYRFELVVHLVRDPLSSIPSIATFGRSAWDYIARHAPIDPSAHLLVRSARYWLHWNELIERRASLRLRIEEMPGALSGLTARLGAPFDVAAAQKMRRDLNTRRQGRLFASFEERCLRLGFVPTLPKAMLSRLFHSYEDITWRDLRALDAPLALEIRRKALEYGYRYGADAD